MPSDKAITEYKRLWLQRFGAELTDGEAAEQAGKLLRLYRAVYGKPPVTDGNNADLS